MLAALVRKEAIELVRDPITVAVAIILPLVLLFLFGYGVSMDIEDTPLAVYDQDATQESRRLVEAFVQSGYFHLHRTLDAPHEAQVVLDRGEARVVLVIPPQFARTLAAGREAQVQALIDGSFSPIALIVSSYVAEIVNRHSAALAQRRLR